MSSVIFTSYNFFPGGKIVKPRVRKSCLFLWIRKLWILSTVNKMFWPIVIYPIYLTIGPWSIGYIVEDHIGAIFAWGIVVHQAFLPGAFTYAYGFVQVKLFQIILYIIFFIYRRNYNGDIC